MTQKAIESDFKQIWQIVLALKSQDDTLMKTIDSLRIMIGKKEKITGLDNALEKIQFDLPFEVDSSFAESIKTLLNLENTRWNAATRVFGSALRHILCHWHVHR